VLCDLLRVGTWQYREFKLRAIDCQRVRRSGLDSAKPLYKAIGVYFFTFLNFKTFSVRQAYAGCSGARMRGDSPLLQEGTFSATALLKSNTIVSVAEKITRTNLRYFSMYCNNLLYFLVHNTVLKQSAKRAKIQARLCLLFHAIKCMHSVVLLSGVLLPILQV